MMSLIIIDKSQKDLLNHQIKSLINISLYIYIYIQQGSSTSLANHMYVATCTVHQLRPLKVF